MLLIRIMMYTNLWWYKKGIKDSAFAIDISLKLGCQWKLLTSRVYHEHIIKAYHSIEMLIFSAKLN